jgi:hypothetical protein
MWPLEQTSRPPAADSTLVATISMPGHLPLLSLHRMLHRALKDPVTQVFPDTHIIRCPRRLPPATLPRFTHKIHSWDELPQVVNLANSLATLVSSRLSSLSMRNHNSNHNTPLTATAAIAARASPG